MLTEATLSWPELIVAGNVGVMRQVNALRRGLRDKDRGHRPRDPFDDHVAGAIAEYAVSKYLGVHWDPAVGITWAGSVAGDVEKIEVRSSFRDGDLFVHDYSFDDRVYLLVVTREAPVFRLAGWILGRDAKQARYWNPRMPRPCYCVPQADLRPAYELVAARELVA